MSVKVPAMRGDDALGFLSAIGLMALSEHGAAAPLQLSWRGGATPIATIHGVESLDHLRAWVRQTFEAVMESPSAAPGLPEDYPEHKRGSGTDPSRMSRIDTAGVWEDADRAWRTESNPWFARWLIALSGQTAVDDKDRVQLTPFYAPTGQMALRSSLFDASADAVRRVKGPGDALTRWRRTSFDGANFDERAKRDATVTSRGKSDNQGAPSPTWLAVMGIRMFPVADDGSQIATVGWQRVSMYPGYTRRSLIWPTWQSPLDPAAIRTLLSQSSLQATQDGQQVRLDPQSDGKLRALGVTAVFGASRRTLTQGDGPLGPARQIWPRPPAPAHPQTAPVEAEPTSFAYLPSTPVS